MKTTLVAIWTNFQKVMDMSGDTWMGLLTITAIVRVVMAMFGKPAITAAESAIYASAVGMFGYSKVNKS